jgi:hypothetical protein
MSYDTDMRIWVSDLDDFVNLDAIFAESEREAEQEALEVELDRLGDIPLFSGKSISSRLIYARGITPKQWKWTKHHAEASLRKAQRSTEIETAFLNAILSLGRRNAVARFARLEDLSFSTAITATFTHGIRALLYQLMAGERFLSDHSCRSSIQRSLHYAASSSDHLAYEKSGLIQRALHDLANGMGGANAAKQLDKEGMRRILALLRLHFSVNETRVRSASDLIKLTNRYEEIRKGRKKEEDWTDTIITGKKIQNWKKRFLHPLTFYYPYGTRSSLDRFILHATEAKSPLTPLVAANELCLATCGMQLMKTAAKKKAGFGE